MIRARSAIIRTPATLDNELQHQSHKNKMLEEDRKTFLRQAEEIKEKYTSELENLKNQNKRLKELRDQYLSSKKARNLKTDLSETAFTSKMALTSNDENFLRTTLNKEKHETKMKKKLLFTLQDKLKDIEDRRQSIVDENPLLRTIRQLEGKLDKIMIRYNEAQSLQQTYEAVVCRLKQERIGYDSQLLGVEQCLKGKEHDFEELLLLSLDAAHAKQAAIAELRQFQHRRVSVQEVRAKYVVQKKKQLSRDGPGAETIVEGQKGKFMLQKSTIFETSYKHDENYQRQELHDYEIALQKLKKVTGVSDANEIIQKFKTQTLTTNSLEDLQATYAAKIEGLKTLKEELKFKLSKVKFSENKQIPGRRRVDEIDAEITTANSEYSKIKQKWDQLCSVLVSITAGVKHLKEMTDFYKSDAQPGEELDDELRYLDTKLCKIYSIVKTDPNFALLGYRDIANSIQKSIRNAYQNNYPLQHNDDIQAQQ